METNKFLQKHAKKNKEKNFFNQGLECAAAKHWSKYTTLVVVSISN